VFVVVASVVVASVVNVSVVDVSVVVVVLVVNVDQQILLIVHRLLAWQDCC
jgi:hypothetical protein